MIAGRTKLASLTRHEFGAFCVDAVYRDLDRCVAKQLTRTGAGAVYAYEDGALATFRAAKDASMACLYDLPIGYWRAGQRLLDAERDRWPQWAATMPGFRDSDEKLARKDEELRLADRIFVASQFTRDSLKDYPGTLAPIEVIPYGFPPPGEPRDSDEVASKNRRLRLLFVGGLSQRKGLADVFAVSENLSADVELTVIGNGPVQDCPALADALKRHRWIPSLPHDEVIGMMRQHDVLLFPSLFEGFGLVISEAMSQGTPVITTDRTAGPDLIEHDANGWLIEAGSTEALLHQVESLLHDRGQIAVFGERARQSAGRRPWSAYGRELADKVRQCLDERVTSPGGIPL